MSAVGMREPSAAPPAASESKSGRSASASWSQEIKRRIGSIAAPSGPYRPKWTCGTVAFPVSPQ